MDKKEKCLNPTCKKKRRCRGLCTNCYASAWKAVRSKRSTWPQLEKAGKVLPASKFRGGKIMAWLFEK